MWLISNSSSVVLCSLVLVALVESSGFTVFVLNDDPNLKSFNKIS